MTQTSAVCFRLTRKTLTLLRYAAAAKAGAKRRRRWRQRQRRRRRLLSLAAATLRGVLAAELRFFAGLSLEEVAEALRVSLRTVEADWKMAKAFLRGKMDG